MNILLNPGFEGGTYQPKGSMSLVLPIGWKAGWLDNGSLYTADVAGVVKFGTYNKYGPRARSGVQICLKPEILVIEKVQPYLDPLRILDGYKAVTGFKLYGTICAWLCQQVPATPGTSYGGSFSAHAWARANEDPGDAHYSHGIGTGPFYAEEGDAGLDDNKINYRFRVGIDPFGGTNPFGSAVIWGKPAHIYNVYHTVPGAEAIARADYITLFLAWDNLWGFVNSNAYFDSAMLEQIGNPIPPDTVDYVVVVNLLPQDATKAEKLLVLNRVHESKQTILQSADDAKRLVEPGKPGSKVIAWGPKRWPGDIVAYLAPCVVETQEFL